MLGRSALFLMLCVGILWPPATCLYAMANPILPGTADAGVIRFNGKYYLMGVHTDGAYFVSRDLVHWDGPHHAFPMDNAWATGAAGRDNEIHACDIALHNGEFHLYWSIN